MAVVIIEPPVEMLGNGFILGSRGDAVGETDDRPALVAAASPEN